MFEIILLAVGLVAFFNLQSRIDSLERKVKEEKKTEQLISSDMKRNISSVSPQVIPTGSISVSQTEKLSSVISEENYTASTTGPQQSGMQEDAGGRWLGKIGVVALLAGVAFFLQYAFVNNIIGIHGRIILGFISGIAMLTLGQVLRKKYKTYSDIILGGGLGLLYLTTFASFAFYHLIDSSIAYGLLICISALAVIMSIVDGTELLARMGVIGAFLTPIFLSTFSASPVELFSYILIVDIGVVATSYFYKWRKLHYFAFLGTAFLSFLMYTQSYSEIFRATFFFYATLYFIVFLVSSVMHHIVRKELSDEGDIVIISLNAGLYAFVSYILLNQSFHAFMGFFMLGLAAIYFLVGYVSFVTKREDRFLNLALPAISVVFLTIAIPIHFEGAWITSAWFTEALVLFALDYYLKGKNLYIFGSIIFVIGMVRFFAFDNNFDYSSFQAFFNGRFILIMFVTFVSYVLLFILSEEKKRDSTENVKSLLILFAIASQLLTLYAITSEINNIYAVKNNVLTKEVILRQEACRTTYGNNARSGDCADLYGSNDEYVSVENQKNTTVSIFWVLYAVLLTAIGFVKRKKLARIFGLILFFVTALKIFVDVWSLGELYRIISSIAFGIVALVGSFLYAKFKDTINERVLK